jgi:hypothetical protein
MEGVLPQRRCSLVRFSDTLLLDKALGRGKYRLLSRRTDARTGKRRNLGTFATRAAAERHERAVQLFKHR